MINVKNEVETILSRPMRPAELRRFAKLKAAGMVNPFDIVNTLEKEGL